MAPKRCCAGPRLAAGAPAGGAAMRVTVVDSGSADGTPEMVAREFPEVACGGAATSASRPPTTWRCASPARPIRPPAEPRHRGLRRHARRGLARFEAEPRIGMVGVKLVTESGALDHACKRSFPTPLSALAHFTGIGRGAGADGRSASTGRPHSATTSRARSTRSTAPSCSAGPRRCARSACSTRATGSTWRTSTGATASGTRAGRSSTSRPGSALHVKGGSSAARRAPRQEIAFHRGMGRFYRRFDAPGRTRC